MAAIAPTPAASPSSPSMKFMAFTSATVSSTVRSAPCSWPRLSNCPFGPPHGTHTTVHCTPKNSNAPVAVTCAGELRQRVQLVPVVDDADDAQHDGGDDRPEHLFGVGVERQAQRRQLVRDRDAGEDAAEHRDAAPARGRRGVHVAAPRPGHGPEFDGHHPHGPDQQERDDGSREPRQEVLLEEILLDRGGPWRGVRLSRAGRRARGPPMRIPRRPPSRAPRRRPGCPARPSPRGPASSRSRPCRSRPCPGS